MEQDDNYQMNIECWATSLMELDNLGTAQTEASCFETTSSSTLVPVAPSTYYRTKGFSSTIGINELINSLDPILTLATKLRQFSSTPDAVTLQHNLSHEIKAFENKAQTLAYRPQTVLAAKYVVCTLLDELLSTPHPQGGDMEWKKPLLMESILKERADEGNQFFLILERSLQDPSAHLDLLELIYTCLKLGYEGKYRRIERGHLELRNTTDHLYHVITHYREEYTKNLHVTLENSDSRRSPRGQYYHLFPPSWVITSIFILVLASLFIFFYWSLMQSVAPTYHFMSSLLVRTAVNR